MGKYILSLTLILSVCVVGFSQKLGYVNSQMILQEMPAVKSANAEIEALQKQLQKKGEGMVTSLQQKYADLQQKEANGELSPKQLQDEAAKLQKEQEELGKFEQEMGQQIVGKQETLIQPILDQVNEAIKEVAKADGLMMVFDSSNSSLLYADDSTDITEKVKAKLGM